MVLEKLINHTKHLKVMALSSLEHPGNDICLQRCLICIQCVFFASSKVCSFLHNMSVGAGFCMRSVRSRQAEVRRAAFRVWTC